MLEPASFGGCYWVAGSGAGRSLVGRWLAARGLARSIVAENWREAQSLLPTSGAIFLELEAPDEAPPYIDQPGRRLCIAAPLAPARPTPFRVVHSAPPESYLRELVAWVAERLPQDGRFDAARALDWLLGEPLERGVLDGPGAALGLCGLADELGPRVFGEPLDQLVRRHAQARFNATLDGDVPHAAFFRKHGYAALVALMRRLLSEEAQAWDAPRAREVWLSLVPEELQREADLEWLKLTLGSGPGALRPAELERAARKLPPGAFRVIRCFEQAGFLEPTSGDRLALGPRFLARTLLTEAVATLSDASPIEWGTALLEGSAQRELEAHVLERARATGGESLAPLLEAAEPSSMAWVCGAGARLRRRRAGAARGQRRHQRRATGFVRGPAGADAGAAR